jgi:hypothetical protein
MGICLFIHNLWYGSLFIHPQPLVVLNKNRSIPEVVDEKKRPMAEVVDE